MARKKTTFDWVREDVDDEAREWVTRRNQSADKAERARLKTLVLDLIARPPSFRAKLPLDEAVLDALDRLADTPATPARRRLVMRTMSLMRETDLDAVDAAMRGDSDLDVALRATERWRTRLLEGGDDDVAALIEAHPTIDVQELRQALRAATGDGKKAERARRRVFELVKAALLEA